MLTRLIAIFVFLGCTTAPGQDITVINKFEGGDSSMVPEDYVLKNVTRQTYIVNEYEPANTGMRGLLAQMISYGLKSFIDNHYRVVDGRIEAKLTEMDFDELGSALVKNAIWIHDLPFSELFPGFSQSVLQRAEELEKLNGSKVVSNELDKDSREIELYDFQEQVFLLKRSAIGEAIDFINEFIGQSEVVREDDDLQNKPLNPADYSISVEPPDQELGSLNLDPDLVFSGRKRRKDKDDLNFSAQVVELLEENNRILAQYSSRFENLQQQIDDIRENNNRGLRSEIKEMRQMIRDLANDKGRVENRSTEYVIFEKNEYRLTEIQKASLNQIVVSLAKNPKLNVLVTGYADKSGNSEYNVFLSKKRAESVKGHLISLGIEESRIVLTYLGDTESTSVGSADRRVEVSLID